MKTTQSTALRRVSRPQPFGRRGHARPNDQALTHLTGTILRRLLAETENPVLHASLRRAAAEAESLAWLTSVPLLVLPTLLEEKARAARFYATRQAELREASREWVSLTE
ncbi:MAG: hypothetical protein KF833_13575 [Verrucomicrobiae bacterium]|nr:hypothetical protein [Verrucomicrobiae bacterium]